MIGRESIDYTVSQLKELERRSGLDRMVAIGKLILERFFSDSAEAWKERRRNKNNSVRRLAQHPECPLSHSSLNQALGIYVTVRALPCVQTFAHVGASHVIAVLHLSLHDRAYWLMRAEQEKWSVRELKTAVLTWRRLDGERRGRPRATPARACVLRVRRAADALKAALDELPQLGLADPYQDVLAEILRDVDALLSKRIRPPVITEWPEPLATPSAAGRTLLRVVGASR